MSKQIKKFIPYILLILLVLVGIFGTGKSVQAADLGTCVTTQIGSGFVTTQTSVTEASCVTGKWTKNQEGAPSNPTSTTTTLGATTNQANQSDFEKAVNDASCGLFSITKGCITKLLYYILYLPSTFFLWMAAKLFNALIAISINSALFKSTFIMSAWAVTRDLSNLFFILILLFAAVQIILGLGHDAKKMIAKVMIMALLINFSMFLTGVIVDTSNVLALVFYNKLNVTDKNGQPIADTPSTNENERNISGAMYYSFDPTKLLDQTFFEKAKVQSVPGYPDDNSKEVAPGILIGIIIAASMIMFFAAYCFFTSGLFFLGRLIELFILIIFSPFAFMSFAIPLLSGVDYIGWDAWFKRLLTVSFMAPIFMFFLYFIFMLLKENIFTALIPGKDTIQIILGVVIPALIILILLMKATDFAKKGSGKLGEVMMTGAKMVGGLALGAATGGAALLGTGLIGGGLNKFSGKYGEDLKEKAKEKGLGGYAARLALKGTDYGTKASFDVRKTKAGGAFAKASGMNLDSAKMIGLGQKEGGFKGKVEREAKALEEESNLYKTTKTDAQVKEWSDKRRKDWEEQGGVGEEPKAYEKAEQLNNDRLKAYQSNLGQSGLLGTVAYTAVKKTVGIVDTKNYEKDKEYQKQYQEKNGDKPIAYDESLAKNINKERVGKAKMIIGGGAAIATGGYVGGLVGAGLGTGYALEHGFANVEGTAENKFSGQLDKDLKKMSDIEDRLNEMKKLLKTQTEVLAKGTDLGIATATSEMDGNGNIKYTVDADKLTAALADSSVKEQDLKSQLEALNRTIAEKGENPALLARKEKLRKEMFDFTMESGKLNALKGIDQTIANTRNQIYNLGGQKSTISSGGAPAAAAPATPNK